MQWILALLFAGAGLGTAAAAPPTTTPVVRETPVGVEATPYPCGGAERVTVRADAAQDARLVCEGVERALAFLADVGLTAPPRTDIDIVQELPGALRGRAVGSYLLETRRGVDAWRHYLRRRDRAAWLREVIAGNVVPEFPSDGP